ncbi:hypothetical protein PJW08_09145 [Tenacibaculum finnmarkense]|nr:hypothetical protein PJW08_09145 [Tenacibaculum finnmarkense]
MINTNDFQELSNEFSTFTGLTVERGNPENFELFFQYLSTRYARANKDALSGQNLLTDEIFDFIKLKL